MMRRNVKCSRCQHAGDETEFPKGQDFFGNSYIAACPKCDNRQSPGDASMRMFGGERPFEYVRQSAPDDPLSKTLHRADEAS